MQKDGKLHVRSSKFAFEAVSAWAVIVDGPNAGVDGMDVAVDRDGGVDVDNGSVGGGMGDGRVEPPVITSAEKSYQLKKDGLCNDQLTF